MENISDFSVAALDDTLNAIVHAFRCAALCRHSPKLFPYDKAEPYLPLTATHCLIDLAQRLRESHPGGIPWAMAMPKLTEHGARTLGHCLSQTVTLTMPPTQAEQEQAANWLLDQRGYFREVTLPGPRPVFIRLPELWWITLNTTSYLSGFYTPPSPKFIAALRDIISLPSPATPLPTRPRRVLQ